MTPQPGSRMLRDPAGADADSMSSIRLSGVRKSFGPITAVNGVDLTVRDGEFFTLLGASGSGKTTLLRLIAGFEKADGGVIELHGRDVTTDPPYARDVNTVFQDYALFPHLNVQKNVEYGLRVKGTPSGERAKRAGEAIEMVGLRGLGKRHPRQLSGGQRQRVALARAVVNQPSVLLLDEPLGALDLKLRQGMQLELKRVQREAGITFVYVTHDQEEALTMSDRIAVFREGSILQVGRPSEIYDHPTGAYVADFIGVSTMMRHDGVEYAVRPERVALTPADQVPPDGWVTSSGQVIEVIYLGVLTRFLVRVQDGAMVNVAQQNNPHSAQAWRVGDSVQVSWNPRHAQAIPSPHPATENQGES
ncbi:MAG: ABC transporter ATP-binding protein [Marmoricola sp.]